RLLGQPVVAHQPDHARHLDLAVDGADPVIVRLPEELGAVLADLAPRREVVGGELAVLQRHDLGEVLGSRQNARRTEMMWIAMNSLFRTSTLASNALEGCDCIEALSVGTRRADFTTGWNGRVFTTKDARRRGRVQFSLY